MMELRALKRLAQSRWLMTTTRCPPGNASSSGLNPRPRMGGTPITLK